ncbi:hypothetical protein EXIGLDRAFT_652624 [Exidia glandulosa HHB12029]|uniref:Cytochrome P450 n=1 Tax=Exidia glandulosa HHB12029 TaxID=1314781 RepID=A0A165ZYW8_EXIGL|nr:hypothetical protein EXIGLDRAFT_652624 [Exidia glandulosa HHB12029]
MPFGIGAANCLGKHLATMSMKMVFAAIVLNFDITPASETNDKSMRIREAFSIFPASGKISLVFTPV